MDLQLFQYFNIPNLCEISTFVVNAVERKLMPMQGSKENDDISSDNLRHHDDC